MTTTGQGPLALAALTALAACSDPGPARATLSVAEAMAGADTAGYARAVEPREFTFPADHGPHPDFRTEWWYFTGNLTADDGGEFGFQLTFFRSALRPHTSVIDSDWATRQAYMAHFALTDVDGERFHAFERFDRGALGLAGADSDPMRVWVGDWRAGSISSSTRGRSRGPAFHIRAGGGDVAIDLVLEAHKPVVLQGDYGLSRKGPERGNASYYYSLTRMAAVGTVRIGADGAPACEPAHRVTGLAWLDREWSTSALSPGLAGWDWFALQLDDGTELMVYRLRADDGGTAPFSAGSFVRRDGSVTRLSTDEFVLDATASWTSPRGGRYPSGWRVRVPSLDLDLEVTPRVRGQELDLAFRYWEGAVTVDGRRDGRQVSGSGYVELTGYTDVPRP